MAVTWVKVPGTFPYLTLGQTAHCSSQYSEKDSLMRGQNLIGREVSASLHEFGCA